MGHMLQDFQFFNFWKFQILAKIVLFGGPIPKFIHLQLTKILYVGWKGHIWQYFDF